MTKHQTQKINRWGDAVSIDVYLIVRESELWFAVHLLVTYLSCDSWALALAPILKTFSKYCFFSVGVFGTTCQASPFSLWEGTCSRIVLLASCKQGGERDCRRVLTYRGSRIKTLEGGMCELKIYRVYTQQLGGYEGGGPGRVKQRKERGPQSMAWLSAPLRLPPASAIAPSHKPWQSQRSPNKQLWFITTSEKNKFFGASE